MRNALIIAGFCAAIALSLAVFALLRQPSSPPPEAAEVERIIAACGIGTKDSGKTAFAVALALRLRELNAQATISSAHVGAIVDTIKDDASGARIYELYANCVKEQTILSLRARGIGIDSIAGAGNAAVSPPQITGISHRDAVPAKVICKDNTTQDSLSPVICVARDVTIKGN
jgi:hypothetical protein